MERREFIQTSCNACLLVAAGYLLPSLAACGTQASVLKADIVNDKVMLPASRFAQPSIQMVRPRGWLYDIAVEKNEENNFRALLMQCTHQENQLTQQGNGFHCSLHGSQFDKEGRVVKGPAERPLKQFPVSIENDQLIIHINAHP